MTDAGLKSVVADLRMLRYRTTDIAKAIGCTRQYVNRILRDLDMQDRPLNVDALPADLRMRVNNVKFPTET